MVKFRSSRRVMMMLLSFITLFSLLFSAGMATPARAATPITFTILHTNDFHGQLQLSGSNPGLARVAAVANSIRTAKGAANVLLVDAGDEMQGSLLSNLYHGESTIAAFNAMNYDVATFGNHEFDWGQTVLNDRTTQAAYPFVSANIVKNDTGNCNTANWVVPDQFKVVPYVVKTLNTTNGTINVGFIGVTTQETPTITIASATAGLCFKDPANSILHYYDTVKSQADIVVVLSHLGYLDGGYGYGIPVYGDQTLANKLLTAGKYVPLIIGGHSHTNLTSATAITVGGKTTYVVQAYYNGRVLGQADFTYDPGTGNVTAFSWTRNAISTSGAEDPTVKAVIDDYATRPEYVNLVNQPIGYSAVDLGRNGGTADNMMGTFVDDAIYNYLNTDGTTINDIDIFFNNAGGIRTDWCYVGGTWVNTGCVAGMHAPALLTYGNMFTILPFGNATVVGQMTGAKILEVLNQAPLVSNGVIQPAGLKFKYYKYTDTLPPGSVSSPYPYAWGAYDVTVLDKGSGTYKPLDLNATYSVGTNEFLAPAGGDGYSAFKYMTNITYWGDMLNAVDAYVTANYSDAAHAYMGPNADGSLDGRIGLNGNGDNVYDPGEIVPLTILHNNDSHGNLYKNGTYAGITELATLIKQEQAHNPNRTLLLNAGDQIQGDGISFYFKSSYTGFAVDGTDLHSPPQLVDLTTDPIIAAMNLLGYDAMTLGNHEFNFGSDVFKGVLGQANFPILDADVTDGAEGNIYGLNAANHGTGVQQSIQKTLGPEGIKVGILGLGNPRIPNYELPSNILGLTFANQPGVFDPIIQGQNLANALRTTSNDDVVIALTHLGFTDPADPWVDTYLASHTTGIDAIIGGHSHTDPTNTVAYPYLGTYKYLPSIVPAADGKPVIINQAYRYNYILGEVVLGLRPRSGGYDVVSQTGRDILDCTGGKTGTGVICTPDTVEDSATKALIDPYKAVFTTYNTKTVGITNGPIDARQAYTQETTGANLQADAAVYELGVKRPDVQVDFHLSGAMSNTAVALTGPYPVTLTVANMFTLMPYENSLVVMRMNGPQLKTVLERAYRNFWYYKYDPVNHGNYSYYTTCMLDVNSVGRIYYKDTSPALPNGNNVMGLVINGTPVDFNDASKFYNVSTVNYLAAGSCNFSDAPGTSLWPLNQIVADTQYYVRDAVIDYIQAKTPVSPAVEGRLLFGDTVAPVITINAPLTQAYPLPNVLTLDFSAVDGADGTTPSFAAPSGVKSIMATLDGSPVTNGQVIDLYTLSLGNHTLKVVAKDYYDNTATKSVTFSVTGTIQNLKTIVNLLYQGKMIDNAGILSSLLDKLNTAQAYLNQGNVKAAKNALQAFINAVQAQSGKHITKQAADLLIADAQWLIANPK